jgi:DNA-binding IclR family transcriptional regulator
MFTSCESWKRRSPILKESDFPSAAVANIQVIDRCAEILRLFSPTQRAIRVATVASETGLQRSTAYRYLASMCSAGLIEKGPDGTYRLGPLAIQVGAAALRGIRILEIVDPYLQSLSDETDQTSVVSVWGGLGPVVARVHEPVDRQVNVTVRTGLQLPIEAAQTVVFLAFLADRSIEQRLLSQLPDFRRQDLADQIDAVRTHGFVDSSEVTSGVRAFAAPIFDDSGAICASLAILGIYLGDSQLSVPNLALPLMKTAESISRALGFSGTAPFIQNQVAQNSTDPRKELV